MASVKHKCNGCGRGCEPEAIFKGVDLTGDGWFCDTCMETLTSGGLTPDELQSGKTTNDITSDQVSKWLAATEGGDWGKPYSEIKQKGGKQDKPVTTQGSQVYQSSWVGGTGTGSTKLCPGHQHPLRLRAEYGYVILSSSRMTGASLDEKADAALFFDQAWGVKSKAIQYITVQNNGVNGVTIPEIAERTIPVGLLEWKDFGPPPSVAKQYLDWTLKELRAGRNIQIGCVGGHGRTGTFFAALLLLDGITDSARDAIAMTRELYCEDAVESISQIQWLYHLNGEPKPTGTKTKWDDGPPDADPDQEAEISVAQWKLYMDQLDANVPDVAPLELAETIDSTSKEF